MSDELFTMGRTVVTPDAIRMIHPQDIHIAMSRHRVGDWGDLRDLSGPDRAVNDNALADGDRILSVYRDRNGRKFWIMTDAADEHGNRAATTVLLPADY